MECFFERNRNKIGRWIRKSQGMIILENWIKTDWFTLQENILHERKYFLFIQTFLTQRMEIEGNVVCYRRSEQKNGK